MWKRKKTSPPSAPLKNVLAEKIAHVVISGQKAVVNVLQRLDNQCSLAQKKILLFIFCVISAGCCCLMLRTAFSSSPAVILQMVPAATSAKPPPATTAKKRQDTITSSIKNQ